MVPDACGGATPDRGASERDALARARLATELAALPPVGSPLLIPLLHAGEIGGARSAISSGALVALIRQGVRAGDQTLVEELFVALLRRIEPRNSRWAARVVARTPAARLVRESAREDLKQELTLHLWQRIAREDDAGWELYFEQALGFAQRHVARSSMRRNGYWPSSAAPEGLPALLLSRLAPNASDGPPPQERIAAPHDALTIADLADLRVLVLRLPDRERVAVVMRFWLDAREHEIGRALGVTSRTVRNLLGRAYRHLRAEYAGGDTEARLGERDEATPGIAPEAARRRVP